jgi:hypothetical protein
MGLASGVMNWMETGLSFEVNLQGRKSGGIE